MSSLPFGYTALTIDLPVEVHEALLEQAQLEGLTIEDLCLRELSFFLTRMQLPNSTPSKK